MRRVSRADGRRARSAGSKDGRDGIPYPSVVDEHGRSAPATSPFIRDECHGAEAYAKQRLHELMARNQGLLNEISLRSCLLVRAYDQGDRETTHLPRFKEALSVWAALVNAERLHVEAYAEHRNRVIEIYWSAVLRTHHVVRGFAAAQREASRNGQVTPGGVRISVPGDDQVRVLDLNSWQPLKVASDLRHITPVETLRESLRAGFITDLYDYGTLPRALDIIKTVLSPTGAH
ncbi:hypothetical protein Q0Z83_045530 [Actinoplanes sichuanensis]|uniref:Uncharacterized protein n=1 Tax=Actinoplanes sichuanensis TaxID=512349 RepID=A0ABW4AAQ0_9ACTN|nr:hypothetical protein [Actinoplanes sichuanensis]BEL06362.1 hypothetical protein Q0Z83_045530 [Actinoplanes sichuanensis]